MTVLPLPDNDAVEPVLKRDRAIILTALCALFVAAWVFIMTGAGSGLSPFELTVNAGRLNDLMLSASVWSPADASRVFAMWFGLAIAVIVPAAAPAMLLHAAENRKRRDPLNGVAFALLFVFGYLVVWGGFSLAAAAVQASLEQAGMMTRALNVAAPNLVGGIFIAAGLYQFSGVKLHCLKHINSPEKYVFSEWYDGTLGALRMGFNLGACLLGSCWLLLGLLFAGGILNILWVVGLAGYVMLEKLSNHSRVISVMFGCALTCWGIFVVVVSLRP